MLIYYIIITQMLVFYITEIYLKIYLYYKCMGKIIQKVWKTGRGQMQITIPKKSGIKPGDYVEVRKVK